jgi:hypothetical protein
MSTTELDTYVQTTLKDYSISPWRRAKEAARAIRAQVLADEGLDEDTILTVPLEWEHRVSGLAEPIPHPVADLIDAEVEHAEALEEVEGWFEHDETMPTMPAEDYEALKDSFDAMFDGDDATAQEKFDKFWKGE